jgi:hypothetical protein
VILVTKQFQQITLDPKTCRLQIAELGQLLESKTSLSEKHDIRPFFTQRPQISAFIGSYMRDIGPATDYTFEYPFYGDFAADLVVGHKADRRFCVIEFEDGRKDSIFKAPKGKSTTEWSRGNRHDDGKQDRHQKGKHRSTALACGHDAAAGGQGCLRWTTMPAFVSSIATG